MRRIFKKSYKPSAARHCYVARWEEDRMARRPGAGQQLSVSCLMSFVMHIIL